MSSVDESTTNVLSLDSLEKTVLAYLSFVKPFIVLLILWELIVQLGFIPEQFLPHVYSVAEAMVTFTLNGQIPNAMWTTMTRAIMALLLAVAIGVPIGLLMGRFRIVEWFFDPLISIGFPVPKVTLIPVFLLWFGFGTVPKVLLATSDAVFPIIISTYAGTKDVNRELIWSARSMGASRFETTWKVIMPSALPEIFNGIQVALPLSFIIVVVAEMVTGGGGLGEMLVLSARFFKTPKEFAAIFAVALLGLVFDRLLRWFRGRVLHWS